MITALLAHLTVFVIQVISALGYGGIGLLMALQTMAVPIPSEIIIPFAGYLTLAGRFSLWGIALSAALGSACGGSIAYLIGYQGGRRLVEKYGRYILISRRDLELADKFFLKFGALAAFLGQLFPVVRSFIGFPAGIAKMKYIKFVLYSFVGSFIWSLVLAFVGQKLGENWAILREKLKGFDYGILVLVLLVLAYWVYRHIRNNKRLPTS